MTEPVLFPNLALAREQAAGWIAREDRGLSADEQREFTQWRANPANARALREMEGMWQDMDQLEVLAEIFPHRPAATAATAAPMPARRRWPLALAASVLVAASGVLLVVQSTSWRRPAIAQSNNATPARHATAVGEHRVVLLPDGSTLALNTDTVVDVTLHAHSRNLTLLRGEAHFTVAHDASRPFLVTIGNRTVRAVGTAFDVRLRPADAMDVLVTEGVVRLGSTDAAPAGGAPTELTAGELLQVDTQGRIRVQKLGSGAQAAWLAWRDGMLQFEGETLQAALDEFSRYTPDRFGIADPQLRTLRIGGFFPAGNTSALLGALSKNFGLEAQRAPDGRWLITRAATNRTGSD